MSSIIWILKWYIASAPKTFLRVTFSLSLLFYYFFKIFHEGLIELFKHFIRIHVTLLKTLGSVIVSHYGGIACIFSLGTQFRTSSVVSQWMHTVLGSAPFLWSPDHEVASGGIVGGGGRGVGMLITTGEAWICKRTNDKVKLRQRLPLLVLWLASKLLD